MLLDEFIKGYCTPTGELRHGKYDSYEVFLTSPAAIMSNMSSCDSNDNPEEVGLEHSWASVFEEKREDNEDDPDGPLAYLSEDGFRAPLCIVHDDGEIKMFHNGNHRLAAAIDLGYTQVPVIFVDAAFELTVQDRWNATQLEGPENPDPSLLVPAPSV